MSEAVVTEFQTMIATLADNVAREAAAIWAWVQDGLTELSDALAWIVAAINRGRAVAFVLADVATSAQIEALSGSPTPMVGVLPVDDTARLVKAVHTITEGADADTAMQLSRLARAEPLSAAQDAAATAMARHGVAGWVRQCNADACQLCRWWSAGGRVWPAAHAFARHPGCNCQPRIVLNLKEIQHF
ncbi:hypothetical protein PR370_15830 [Mycobacterium marinum]|uniref:hypothetical protein n=1 Tax=Mycobacterium marinum TaxID=1781 RepID=UPI0023593CC3|nr:hypothetical protein [Mycobacterium marinum]MDC8982550.1 hypothetical protein [Mycobacterium marinum]MDC8999064.1 hypothetical protein [Mycobacterium marinum]MDC9011514.1 hypothetical protein [Mycobacterium marinum]